MSDKFLHKSPATVIRTSLGAATNQTSPAILAAPLSCVQTPSGDRGHPSIVQDPGVMPP